MTNETTAEPLDHRLVAARGLIERYDRGTLPAEEEERFEAHLVDCAECQDELAARRSFVRGLRAVAVEEATRAAVRGGLLAWLSRRAAVTTLAAVALLGLGLVAGRLWRQDERLESRLAEPTTAAQAASTDLAAPLAGLPVVLLGVVRGEEEAPVVSPAGPYSLAVDAGGDPRFSSYAVRVLDASGEARFEREGLLPDDLEVIQLVFPAAFLPPGDYRLVAHGSLPGGESVEIGSHPFRVAPAG